MSAYRYYENEAARHAEAKAIVLTETRARELCDYLCDKATKDGIDGGYPFNPLKAVEMHKKNVGFSGTTVERVELRVSDRAHSWSSAATMEATRGPATRIGPTPGIMKKAEPNSSPHSPPQNAPSLPQYIMRSPVL